MSSITKIGRYFLLILWLPLSACFDNQEKQIANCKLHTLEAGVNPESIGHWQGSQRMPECMAAAGYVMGGSNPKCTASAGPAWVNANCYERASRLRTWFRSLEFRWRSILRCLLRQASIGCVY